MDKKLELEIQIFIAQELEKGTSLSDIQNLVNGKFDQHMTYMDIRIMASALDIDWRSLDPNVKKEDSVVEETESPAEEDDNNSSGENISENGCGCTEVEVSPLARPGMMFSGKVRFASGSTAEWYVDSMGRLGLENLVGEKPTGEDIEEFQKELDKAVRKMRGQ